jgi:acyl-CoA reductase-like NAD-dependent aldehyde dehydrogenase
MSTERVIVQREIAPALISALMRLASKLKAGDPTTDPSAQLGCLFTEASAQGVCSLLAEAKQQGAEFLLGDGTRNGSIVQPHVLKGVKPGMRAWDRESFGPVVAITEVETIDEAVELANTRYEISA